MPILNHDNLRDFFDAQDEVLLAYLFGSHATGQEYPLSDVDIGVLLSERVPHEKYLRWLIVSLSPTSSISRPQSGAFRSPFRPV